MQMRKLRAFDVLIIFFLYTKYVFRSNAVKSTKTKHFGIFEKASFYTFSVHKIKSKHFIISYALKQQIKFSILYVRVIFRTLKILEKNNDKCIKCSAVTLNLIV